MAPLRRTLNNVRAAARLAPVRPAYAAGFRAAIATVAPLVVGAFLAPGAGTWMSLAGFNGSLSDRGGPYRTRAATMGVLTLLGALALALGTLGSGRLVVAVPLAFTVAAVCSLARVWGNVGATVGGTVLATFVIALAIPPATLHEALVRAGFALVGGAWAMLLSLVLWPLRPYRPVRLSVAACYRALADFVDDMAARVREGREPQPGSATVRGALEEARAVLAAVRRGRPGETGRGERLLVLREVVDQLFGHLVALTETIETIPRAARDPRAQAALADTLAAVAASVRGIADRIVEERDAPAVSVAWSGDALRAHLPATSTIGEPDPARTHYQQAATLLDRLEQYAGVGAATAQTLNDERPAPVLDGILEVEEPEPPLPLLASLRAILAPESVILRHALRLGLVTAAAVWLTSVLGINRGYWVTITIVVILQPYTGASTQKALQRVLGTVLGGMLTAGLGALFHDPRAILCLSFVFAATCVALLPLNYAAYSVFLTPTFVLLAEASAGDWHLAGVRILNTLMGAALAVVGARLLWPEPEWNRLPAHMAEALRANRDYLRCAVDHFDDRSETASRILRGARREVGLATVNAEESFQRLLGEHGGDGEELAPLMTFLTYTRRFTASVAALALSRHAVEPPAHGALEPIVALTGRVLDDLAAALTEGRPPAPLPPPGSVEPDPSLPPLLRARVNRLVRQLRTLHDAVERWATRDVVGKEERGEPARASA